MSDHETRRLFSATTDALARDNFAFFAMRAFRELYDTPYLDSWHIHAMAFWLTQAAQGSVRRLVITMPPRHLKSFLASICLPAWILGRNPGERLVCASYAQKLSEGHCQSKCTDW